MSSRNGTLRWIPALLLMAVIAFISHQSDPMTPLAPFTVIGRLGKMLLHVPDYVAHFSEYFVLTLTISYALHNQRMDRPLHTVFIALLVVAVFAFSDELHQAFIPRRTSDIRDFGVDMVGAVCALVITNLGRLISRLLVVYVGGTRDPI